MDCDKNHLHTCTVHWWTEYWLKITHQSIDGLNIYPDLPKNHAQSTDGLNASAPVKITGSVHWWIAILLVVTWSPNSPLMDYMLLHSSKSHAQSIDELKFFATDLINKYPVHWWIEFLPLPWQKKTQSTDGLKIVCWWNKNFRCFVPLTWIHKCAQSTDGLTHSPLMDWIVTPALTKKKKKQSSDGLKFVCCWNKNFLCFARQNHTNSPLIDWILHSSKSYALYAMKFYTCPDFNQMHTFHCRIQKCSPVQLKITGKQMDADISPTLANNHMHTVQTRTKTFLSTISHFDKFGVKKKRKT